MADDGKVIDLCEWCPGCHRRLDGPSPTCRPGAVTLLFNDQETGRWHHITCLVRSRPSKNCRPLLSSAPEEHQNTADRDSR